MVNINNADAAQLAHAAAGRPQRRRSRIVDYRKQNGAFKKADDLMLVQGIGEKTFELIKPYVATSGETTLREKVKQPLQSSPSSKSGGKSTASPSQSSRQAGQAGVVPLKSAGRGGAGAAPPSRRGGVP